MVMLPLAARAQTNSGIAYAFTTMAGEPSSGSADGVAWNAQFNEPQGIAFDSAGNMFISDTGNRTIRRMTPAGVVTTIAGYPGARGTADGVGSTARFYSPGRLTVDGAGNIFVVEPDANTIRMLTPTGTNWLVRTIAGLAGNAGSNDGTNSAALFDSPRGIVTDSAGDIYVADALDNVIRMLVRQGTNWVVTTIAGSSSPGNFGFTDGIGTNALFNGLGSLTIDAIGNIYIADFRNQAIRMLSQSGSDWLVTTYATNNSILFGMNGSWYGMEGICLDHGNYGFNICFSDINRNSIRKVSSGAAQAFTEAGNGPLGLVDGNNMDAEFRSPFDLTADTNGILYVADTLNNVIRRVGLYQTTSMAGSVGSTGSADGVGSAARFNQPNGAALDAAGNLYFADTQNHTIRRMTPAGFVTTIAGQAGAVGTNDGPGTTCRFNTPYGVAVALGGNVFVADYGNPPSA